MSEDELRDDYCNGGYLTVMRIMRWRESLEREEFRCDVVLEAQTPFSKNKRRPHPVERSGLVDECHGQVLYSLKTWCSPVILRVLHTCHIRHEKSGLETLVRVKCASSLTTVLSRAS